MLVRSNYGVNTERYEIEKESGSEERFLGFIHDEVKHSLAKEIVKNLEVKEVTKRLFTPIEFASKEVGNLTFESEINIITAKEKEDVFKILTSLLDSDLSTHQQEKVKEIIKILNAPIRYVKL